MAGIKIVDLPPLGRDLASTDLLELSLAGGTGSRKITGQEIMNTSKLNIGTTAITSGVVGRVLFEGAGNVVQESSSLFWDNTNTGLSILSETSTSSERGILLKQFNNGIQGALSTFQKSRGSIASPANVAANDLVGLFQFSARVGGTYTSDRAIFGANMATSSGLGLFFSAGSSDGSYIPSLYIHPTGNAVFGTTQSILTGITDAGFKLDVNGTARISGTFQVNQSNQVIGDISFQSGAGGGILRLLATSAGKASGSFYYDGTDVNNSAYGAFGIATSGTYFGTTGSVLFASSKNGTGTQLPMSFGGFNGSWTNWMQIKTNGNVLINTTTDDGFKFDVNGTARVQGLATLAGTMTASGAIARNQLINGTLVAAANNDTLVGLDIKPTFTNGAFTGVKNLSFRVGNSYGPYTSTLSHGVELNTNVGISGSLDLGGDSSVLYLWRSGARGNGAVIGSTYESPNFGHIYFGTPPSKQMILSNATGNLLINTTTDAGFRLDVNGTLRVTQKVTLNGQLDTNQTGSGHVFSRLNDNGTLIRIFNWNYGNSSGNTWVGGVEVASALFALNSTTTGFLPPRMTQAQRNAIASPAIGLEIYQTDATEGKYIYKSSGWTYIG